MLGGNSGFCGLLFWFYEIESLEQTGMRIKGLRSGSQVGPFQSCHSFKETLKENSKKWTEDGKPIGHLRNPSTVVTLEIQAGKLQGGQSSEGMKTCHRVEKKAIKQFIEMQSIWEKPILLE